MENISKKYRLLLNHCSDDKNIFYNIFIDYQKDLSEYISSIKNNNKDSSFYNIVKEDLIIFKSKISDSISFNEFILNFLMDNFYNELKNDGDLYLSSMSKYINNYLSKNKITFSSISKIKDEQEREKKIFYYLNGTINYFNNDLNKISNSYNLDLDLFKDIAKVVLNKINSSEQRKIIFSQNSANRTIHSLNSSFWLTYDILLQEYSNINKFSEKDVYYSFFEHTAHNIYFFNSKNIDILKNTKILKYSLENILEYNKIKENTFVKTLSNYAYLKDIINYTKNPFLDSLYKKSFNDYMVKYLPKNLDKKETISFKGNKLNISTTSNLVLFETKLIQNLVEKDVMISNMLNETFMLKNNFFEKKLNFSELLEQIIINNKQICIEFYQKDIIDKIPKENHQLILLSFLNQIFETNNFNISSLISFFSSIDKNVFVDFFDKNRLDELYKHDSSIFSIIEDKIQTVLEKNKLELDIFSNNHNNKNNYKI